MLQARQGQRALTCKAPPQCWAECRGKQSHHAGGTRIAQGTSLGLYYVASSTIADPCRTTSPSEIPAKHVATGQPTYGARDLGRGHQRPLLAFPSVAAWTTHRSVAFSIMDLYEESPARCSRHPAAASTRRSDPSRATTAGNCPDVEVVETVRITV